MEFILILIFATFCFFLGIFILRLLGVILGIGCAMIIGFFTLLLIVFALIAIL